MRKRTAQSTASDPAVVLFGLDEGGKPKAARFADGHASLAEKAAKQLQLQIVRIVGPALIEVAARLPVGRIHTNGRSVVPNVRRDLYAKLLEAAGTAAPAGPGPQSSGAPTSPGGNGPPQNWDEIVPGQVVVAQESPIDGWYDALVLARTGDMLTLRWRDYPEDRKFTRHRLSVALSCSFEGSKAAKADPSSEPPPAKKPVDKAASSSPPDSDQGLPTTWDSIDLNHLVLAKGSDPWPGWWEAIPIERKADVLTLRWRDYPHLQTVVRNRYSLALMYPHR